jgi:transposase
MLDHKLEPERVRRIEVITGTGRRRRFSEDDKARIVEETLTPGAVVSEVARQHGLTPQQLFTWRRRARQTASAEAGGEASRFVPAVVDRPVPARSVRRRARGQRRSEPGSGIIEVEIEGVTIRVGRDAEPKTVSAVLRVLKSGA